MIILRNRISKINFIVIFTLSCLIFLIGTTRAIPQFGTSNNDSQVRVGIRKAASPVEKFCRVFGETLNSKVPQLNVTYPSIFNQYIRRFEGLQGDLVDIECSPNSTESGELLDPKGNRFSETIVFSGKSFYTTGTKLLLKTAIAKDLADSQLDEFNNKLRNLSIVVAQDTTTYQKLNHKNAFY